MTGSPFTSFTLNGPPPHRGQNEEEEPFQQHAHWFVSYAAEDSHSYFTESATRLLLENWDPLHWPTVWLVLQSEMANSDPKAFARVTYQLLLGSATFLAVTFLVACLACRKLCPRRKQGKAPPAESVETRAPQTSPKTAQNRQKGNILSAGIQKVRGLFSGQQMNQLL